MKKLMIIAAILLFLQGCATDKETVFELNEKNTDISSSSCETEADSYNEISSNADTDIFVYVCGEVNFPGVYELEEGSRVFEAIEAAGGALEGADLDSVNQAALLTDGQQIKIYSKEEMSNNISLNNENNTSASSGKVNINTADKTLLMTLPGIGESRAGDIIKYRDEHGLFSSIEDIKNISGIKDKMFEKIKDYIEI